MKIVFLGTGSAFNKDNPNTSLLVLSEKTNILLDCGFSSAQQLWKFNEDPDFLDAIYISHLHSDHVFGLPPVIYKIKLGERTKPLSIICKKEFQEHIEKLLDYVKVDPNETFDFLRFIHTDKELGFNDLKMSFAPTIHSRENLAIKVENNNKSVCYSGDGMFNNETEDLYKNSDLVVHEAYLYNKSIMGHACATDLVDMAKRSNVKALAFVHIKTEEKIVVDSSKELKIIIPEPFDEYEV